jgi:hypothetical protein
MLTFLAFHLLQIGQDGSNLGIDFVALSATALTLPKVRLKLR